MSSCVNARTWNLLCKGLICPALGLITLAIFAPALTHDFLVYDDQVYVTENAHVQAGLTWQGVAWAFRSCAASNWHPVTWLSHMLDCQLYGLRPAGHHLTNVLLHTANTLLLFLVLSRMTGAMWRSTCVAALFAWHPLHVESVAWVAERKDVLCSFFWMLTLLADAKHVAGDRGRVTGNKADDVSLVTRHPSLVTGLLSPFYWLSFLCFALALMSKPMAVTLPFVLLLLDFWPLKRFTIYDLRFTIVRVVVEKIPFLVLSVVACVLTLRAQEIAIVSTAGLTVAQRIAHTLAAYNHYFWAMFFPHHLAVYYPYVINLEPATVGFAGVVVALIILLAVIIF